MLRLVHSRAPLVIERFQGRSLARLDAPRKSARTTPPTGALPINLQPVERAYDKALNVPLAELRALIDQLVIPVLVVAVQTQADFRDSIQAQAATPTRQDSPQTDLDLAADRVREMMASRFPREKINDLAFGTFDRAQALHREQQAGQLRHTSIGISIFQDTPDLAEQSRAFVRVNTRQITSLNRDSIDRIERVVSEGIRFGLRGTDVARGITDELRAKAKRDLDSLPNNADPRVVELAAQVIKEFEIAERRATFIARDQIAKANADLSRSRQEANGVTKFIWRTLGDERVRPTHADRNGRTYSWENGSGGIYPGQDPNCRCYAEAVL